MNLAEFQFDLPIYEVWATVEHATPRTPTVFEKMVLELIDQGQREHPTWSRQESLATIFSERLGVVGAPNLLLRTVEDLLVLGAVQRTNHAQDLVELPVDRLALTLEGTRMHVAGSLPSKPKTEVIECHVNSWDRSVSDWTSGLAPSRAAAPVELDSPDAGAISGAVRAWLQSRPPPWLTGTTQIVKVTAEIRGSTWTESRAKLACDPSGNLLISMDGESTIAQWLRNLPQSLIWQKLLRPRFGQHSEGPELDWALVQQAQPHALRSPEPPTSPAGELTPGAGPGALLRVERAGATRQHATPPARTTVLFDDASGTEQAGAGENDSTSTWAGIPSGFPESFATAHVWTPTQAPEVAVSGWLGTSYDGHACQIPLVVGLNPTASGQMWSDILPAVEHALTIGKPWRLTVVPILWGSPQPALRLRDAIEGLPLPQQKVILDAFCAALETAQVPCEAAAQSALFSALKDALLLGIQSSADLDVQQTVQVLGSFAALAPKTLGADVEIQGRLLDRMSPIQSRTELGELQKLLAISVTIPTRLLGATLIADWVSGIVDLDATLHWGSNLTPGLEPALNRLRQTYSALCRAVGLQVFESAGAGRIVPCENVSVGLQQARQWADARADAMKLLGGSEIDSGDFLSRFSGDVEVWNKLVRAKLRRALPTGESYLVTDTNSLVDPDGTQLLKELELAPNSHLVISHRVLRELDGLKKDAGPLGKRARDAIRALQEVAHEEVSADWDLLPAALQETGNAEQDSDNEILAAALKLQLSPVTLVTSDRVFSIKANQQGIPTATPSVVRARFASANQEDSK